MQDGKPVHVPSILELTQPVDVLQLCAVMLSFAVCTGNSASCMVTLELTMDNDLFRGRLSSDVSGNPALPRPYSKPSKCKAPNRKALLIPKEVFIREICFEMIMLQGKYDGLSIKRTRQLCMLDMVLRTRGIVAVSMRMLMNVGYHTKSPYSTKRMFDNMNDLRMRGYVERIDPALWCLSGKGKQLVALYYSWLSGEHDEEAGLGNNGV